MFVKVSNIKMPVDAGFAEVFSVARKRLGLPKSEVLSEKILRRSIDARRGKVALVYSVLVETEKKIICDGKDIVSVEADKIEIPKAGTSVLNHRPVVVGFGPCGMFCALYLARQGYRPVVLERGADVETRTKLVDTFWQGGELDENTNVQFGEGGAGTFSDGKLTTRIGDGLIDAVLLEFVSHGAPEDILYHAMPHIGTDVLKGVVKEIREEILSLGGEVRFCTQVADISVKDGKISGLTLSNGDVLLCDVAVFAIGHSARDTYEMLYRKDVKMIQKPFSVGFRAEHLQSEIDRALYGDFAGNPALGAASYQLSYREQGRGCYSFCMCPGGSVVCASSEKETVVTNGMSERARDKKNSNSAICVNVSGADFGNNHPLAGIAYQRELERKAFRLGGGDYSAPVQLLGDYLEGRVSTGFREVEPSILRGTRFADLNELFSPEFNNFMKTGIRSFERRIKGFTRPDAVLTGAETRTSAPVRILRNENGVSENVCGLMPAGEGAGYAGGIMSAAVDGIKTAFQIIKVYKPLG